MSFFRKIALSLTLTLLTAFSLITASKADIADGQFSTNQIFDVQYYWSGTTLNASNFIAPYDMNFQHPTVSAGQYFKFFNSTTNPGTYGLGLYNSDGTLSQVVHNTGTLQAIGPDALFYIGSGFFGTVITTSAGYSYGQNASFTNMDTSVTGTDTSSYTWASTTPLAAGQTASSGGSGSGSGGGSSGPNYVTVLTNTNITTVNPTSNNSPPGEGASQAIDGNSSTKYLNFDRANAGFTIKLDTPRVIRGVTFTTANDFEPRDPSKYSLFGSNDGINWTTIVDAESITLSSNRYTTTSQYNITNNDAYFYYFITFPSIKAIDTYGSVAGCQAALGTLACDSVQIGDVTYYYDTTYTTYTVPTDGGSGTIANPGTAGSNSSLAPPGPVAVNNGAGTTATNPAGTTTLTVTNAGTYTNNGTNGNVTNTGTFTNNGTTGDVTNSGSFNNNGTTGDVTNQASGTFNNNSGGTTGAVTNAGTFNNSGTVTTVNNSGTFNNNSGGTTGAFTNSGTLTNAGTVASLTNTGTVTNSGTVTGSTTNTSGTITNTGTMSTVDNSGTFNNDGTTGDFTNMGTLTSSGTIGTLVNNGNGTLNGNSITGNVTNGGNLYINDSSTTGDINNMAAGLLDFNGSGGIGLVTNAGTFNFAGNGTTNGIVNSGTANISGTGTTGAVTNSGTANVSGAANIASVNNTGTFNLNTTGATVGSVTNAGTWNISGAGGDVGVAGFTQTSAGTLVMDGSQKLNVNGPAVLGGALTVNNAPTTLGRYTLITGSPLSGEFSSYSLSNSIAPYESYLKQVGNEKRLYITPNTTATLISINTVRDDISKANGRVTGNVTGLLGNDCSAPGLVGGCLSINYGNGNIGTGDLQSGSVTLSKAVTDNIRVGVNLGHSFTNLGSNNVTYKADTPAYGLFAGVTTPLARGRSIDVMASVATQKGEYNINRPLLVGISGTESGVGSPSTDVLAYQLKTTYSMPVTDTVTVSPYVAIRRSHLSVNGYTEMGPLFPLTIESQSVNSTDVIAGVGVSKKLTDKLTASASVGVTQNVQHDASNINGSSEVKNLSNFNSPMSKGKETSASVGAGLSYQVAPNTKVGVNVGWQDKTMFKPSSTSVGISLTFSF